MVTKATVVGFLLNLFQLDHIDPHNFRRIKVTDFHSSRP